MGQTRQITVYDFLDFLASSGNAGAGAGNTGNDGKGRITTLQKKGSYKEANEKMAEVGLLNLRYSSMPEDGNKRADYVIRVIGTHIRKLVSAAGKGFAPCQESVDEIRKILLPADENIAVEIVDVNTDVAARAACVTLNEESCYRVEIPCMGGHVVYGAFSEKRRKQKCGYYYLRSNRRDIVHVVCLESLLAKAFLFSGLAGAYHATELPIVREIFEEYFNEGGDASAMFAESVRKNSCMPLSAFFKEWDSLYGSRLHATNNYFPVIKDAAGILHRTLGIYNEISYENKCRNEMAHSIATAYITKKNIPKAVADAMEGTEFMNFFKFVEFDEDVDLESVHAVEKEFTDFNRLHFSGKRFKDVTLRFRKLGKHKAGGLYYPTMHTLCVDIRHPGSFMHEYFHMLDDQLGDLSLDTGFSGVAAAYKDAFLGQELDEATKRILDGKSKFNADYYLRRCEIFARCGEIYLSRILKAESSLLDKDDEAGFAYPDDAKLNGLVESYYGRLLSEILPSYNDGAAAGA